MEVVWNIKTHSSLRTVLGIGVTVLAIGRGAGVYRINHRPLEVGRPTVRVSRIWHCTVISLMHALDADVLIDEVLVKWATMIPNASPSADTQQALCCESVARLNYAIRFNLKITVLIFGENVFWSCVEDFKDVADRNDRSTQMV